MEHERVMNPRDDHWRAWWVAIRPHTLPAGAAPVLVGTGVAVAEGMVAWPPALAALIGALLIQIGTNLANDYFDARHGVDTAERAGFTRVTHEGLLSPSAVWRATIGCFAAAILLGSYLVWIGGLPIVVIGLVSVICGLAYAGGPFPFGSRGLGDLFVFVFFGIVAVMGTYYVQAAAVVTNPPIWWVPPDISWQLAFLASIPMGCLTTSILVVNNLRDRETDRAAGKYTLAVLIGVRGSKFEYVGLLGIAYVVPAILAWQTGRLVVLLPLVTIPLAARLAVHVVGRPPDERLNLTLTRTGQLLSAYAVLFAAGLVGV